MESLNYRIVFLKHVRITEGNACAEDLKNINFKLPRIYLMDCTLNDCSLILKSMTQVLFVNHESTLF